MKRTIQWVLTALLLLAATGAKADSYKGTLERHGVKMEYAFSGGTVTNKKDPIYSGVPTQVMATLIDAEVKPGTTLKASCEKLKGLEEFKEVRLEITAKGTNGYHLDDVKTDDDEVSYSYKVPDKATEVTIKMIYKCGRVLLSSIVTWKVVSQPSTTTDSFKWDDVAKDEHCPKCKQPYSGYEIHNLSGKVGKRCKDNNDSFSETSVLEPVYFNDCLQTLGESEAKLSYGDDEDCIIIKPNTTVQISKLADGNDRFTVFKGQIIGKDLNVPDNKKPSFLLSTCIAYPRGTVFVLEDDGKQSRVWLLSGEMDVISKKTKKKITLKPGQATTVSADGQQKMQKFNVNAAAMKFGIDATLPDATTSPNAGTIFSVDNLNFKVLSEKTVEVTGEVRGTYSGKVKIPQKVKYNDVKYSVVGIGKKAFANQTQMTEVSIPNTIRAIAEDAFLNTGLEEVTIPGDQVSIVKNAFRNCEKLIVVTLKGKKSACSPDAFIGCTNMKELRIKGISESNNGRMLNGTNAVIKVIK